MPNYSHNELTITKINNEKSKFEFKKFIAGVNAGDWKTAAVEMMDSRWAKQVGDRAVRLRNRILTI